MAVRRMEHVGVVVRDLDAAAAFFAELGLERDGDGSVEGDWVDRIVGLDGVRSDLAMMRTPDGGSRLELTAFRHPPSPGAPSAAPANELGIRHILFVVDDIHDTVSRLRAHGGRLIGEVVRYEDSFLLCYLRGPEGIIIELAEELS